MFRMTTILLCLLLLIASSWLKADADGEALFFRRCAMCHMDEPSGIPAREVIAAYPRERIVDALLDGAMKEQAFDLSEQEIHAVVDYLKASEEKQKEK